MQFLKTAETSLSNETRQLLVISRFVGVNPKSNWHKIYALSMVVCQLAMIGWIWYFYVGQDLKYYSFNLFVHGLQSSCRMISIFVILGSGLFDGKRFMFPLKDFANIDESLKSLGGRIDNRSTWRLEMSLFTCIALMPFVCWIVEISLQLPRVADDQVHLILFMGWIHNTTVMITCAVTDCSFRMTVSIIRNRFKEINSIIRRTGKRNVSYSETDLLEVPRVHTGNDILGNLQTLRKQYHDLWRIGNRAYGPHLLVGATTSLALITGKLWEMYSLFITRDQKLFLFIGRSMSWTLFGILRMFLLAKACDSTVAEAKATYVVLEELGMKEKHNTTIKAEIRDFFTQVQLEVRNFTACGFFDINFTMICGILGAACTYLVILIQMGDSKPYICQYNMSNMGMPMDDENHVPE